jgi:hypothetical protein
VQLGNRGKLLLNHVGRVSRDLPERDREPRELRKLKVDNPQHAHVYASRLIPMQN